MDLNRAGWRTWPLLLLGPAALAVLLPTGCVPTLD
jgi:hypothetical protein